MPQFRQQTTISNPVSVSGFGFWSGINVTIEFRPAPAFSGLVFVRTDLPGQPRIEAALQNRIPGPRRTTLSKEGVRVEMVEHLLAALSGLQIDNCEIHLDGVEVPGLDGSSEPFVKALSEADVVKLNAPLSVVPIVSPIRIEVGDSWIEARPSAAPHLSQLRIVYELDYPNAPAIGFQRFALIVSTDAFAKELAAARTFLLENEAQQLLQQGLGNRVAYSDVLVFDTHGPIQNHLRFPDECVRHKMLDMIGDFALAGGPLVGEISASRTGHELNAQLVAQVLQQNSLVGYRYSA